MLHELRERDATGEIATIYEGIRRALGCSLRLLANEPSAGTGWSGARQCVGGPDSVHHRDVNAVERHIGTDAAITLGR